MENQFTQGPWNVGWTFFPEDESIAYGINRNTLATVSDDEATANARLIAAAPALYAALANAIRELKWAADNSKNYEEPVSLAVIQGCEAALALVDKNGEL